MKSWGSLRPLPQYRHEHVHRHRNPYLCLDRVLRRAKERLDAQVLLDPLEEELDLPPVTIELCNGERRDGEMIGQEIERLFRACIVSGCG